MTAGVRSDSSWPVPFFAGSGKRVEPEQFASPKSAGKNKQFYGGRQTAGARRKIVDCLRASSKEQGRECIPALPTTLALARRLLLCRRCSCRSGRICLLGGLLVLLRGLGGLVSRRGCVSGHSRERYRSKQSGDQGGNNLLHAGLLHN